MFRTARSLRWAAWATLVIGVVYLAFGIRGITSATRFDPFEPINWAQMMQNDIQHFWRDIILNAGYFVLFVAAICAILAVGARAALKHPTRATLGAAFLSVSLLFGAIQPLWNDLLTLLPARMARVGTDDSLRQALVHLYQSNVLLSPLLSWGLLSFGVVGLVFLGWALLDQSPRTAYAALLTAVSYALFLVAVTQISFAASMQNTFNRGLLLTVQTFVAIFPALTMLSAGVWLRSEARATEAVEQPPAARAKVVGA
jgi:hypothetical protein